MVLWRSKKQDKIAGACNPTASPYARFDQAGLTLGGREILRDLSLTLDEHRIGVIGLNGSGKSSFVRLLNGLHLADSGRVTLFGAEATDVRSELPRHVGFVFQNPDHQAIFPTVEEEIAFGLTQLGATKQEAQTQALEFLDQHGCSGLAAMPFAELSGGQKQLICILAVLVMNPGVLVLDEPMTSLDALASRRIFDKLMSLPQRIVMVSHNISLLQGFDRILWLEDGRVRMDGPAAKVIAAYQADIERRSGTFMEVAAI
ncbi:energy-coupling factor ABC transporter ATP-binding protein [Labrenzia sp. PHM005]|uniref:energy-coupling factor ABC transporter ATP-binding protein n=1 Tax=Labrenzia sp. PHM005 TaxID=2590016 RepID=UPI0011402E25|nr:ABC transporter ATP-binding protein [Labrenzia sp. PHM005]QDG75044.1 ABC transporter ATP-binding protein [Labrenzia sp. PHM005]